LLGGGRRYRRRIGQPQHGSDHCYRHHRSRSVAGYWPGTPSGTITRWSHNGASYRIRNAMYERFQRLSFAFHDRSQTGQLMSRALRSCRSGPHVFSMGLLGFIQVVIMVNRRLRYHVLHELSRSP
jgi:hypothetical protein